MAEFKVTSGIDGEIAAFSSGGSQINQAYAATSSDGVETLQAAMSFIEAEQKIRNLLALYASLVQKDAADLTDMIESVRRTDAEIGAKLRG